MRGTRWSGEVPNAWLEIGHAARARAMMPRINLAVEAEKFADYWTAKSGTDATKLDWVATWRNWCRNARAQQTNIEAQPARPDNRLEMALRRVRGALKGFKNVNFDVTDARLALQAKAITQEEARRLGL